MSERLEAINQLLATGVSRNAIAKQLGLTKGVVSGLLHRQNVLLGVTPPIGLRKLPDRSMSEERKQQIREMLRNGAFVSHISATLRCSKESARRLRNELGIKPSNVNQVSHERMQEMRRLISEDVSSNKIVRMLHCDRRTVVRVRHEMGAPPEVAQRPVLIRFPTVAADACCWPLGNPGEADFSFCGDKVAKGADVRPPHSYCLQHRKLAYVKVQPAANRDPAAFVWTANHFAIPVPKKASS